MSLSVIAFLQALATLGLVLWQPATASGAAMKFLLYCASGFFGAIFLLAGLFTLWWPPSMPGVVAWSAVTLILLAWIAIQRD